MTANHDLDRRLDEFLRDGPTELPMESFDAVRDRTEQTRQRVVIGPWRMPNMSKFVPVGLGAAAVVVAFVLGAQFLGPATPSGVGGVPSSSPTATLSPSATTSPTTPPSSTPAPSLSPSPAPSAPPLTQSFTSTMHGISVSYPEGWVARAATEPWTDRPGVPQYIDPGIDVLKDPVEDGHLFLYFASQPIGDSTPEDWVAKELGLDGCAPTEPIAVDGAAGLFSNNCAMVGVTTAGRGYWIALYTPTAGERHALSVAPYDRAWFEAFLATVKLQPEDALDAAP